MSEPKDKAPVQELKQPTHVQIPLEVYNECMQIINDETLTKVGTKLLTKLSIQSGNVQLVTPEDQTD